VVTLDELQTPVAVVDLQALRGNILKLQAYLDAHGIANRPHIKTHKIPEIAWMQLNAGAVGITCQKLGEAEVMAQAGIRDIFLPYNMMGAARLDRVIALARRINLSLTADSYFCVQGLSAAAHRAGIEIPVLVEYDAGMGRCGVQTPEEAVALAQTIHRAPGLRFGGLMTYPTSAAAAEFAQQTIAMLEQKGQTVQVVSGGGTPVMWHAHEHPIFTEHRAGTYVYGDRHTLKSGAMELNEIGLHVITTVVSRPTADRGILDGGSKTFSSDLLGNEGHGMLLEYPAAKFYKMSEEHGFVDFSACPRKPQIGERVTVVPNHCCVVSNLFNEVVGVRGDKVEVVWPVAARGRLQ
jgi:D-serine deaminase-like pyridoxal phosphate-dependent protein